MKGITEFTYSAGKAWRNRDQSILVILVLIYGQDTIGPVKIFDRYI